MNTATTLTTDANTLKPTCQVHLTDAAQERILDLRDNMHKPAMIRLFVRGGGCSGFEYQIDMAGETDPDDILIEVNPYIHLYIDPFSAPYLEGTTIDYEAHTLAARFVFKNPQATSTCGCGSSFSVE